MMRKLGLLTFLTAMGLVLAAPSSEAAPASPHGSCGDGQCAPPEDCSSCPQDCGSCCGNNKCEPPEDCHSCPQDCGQCH
jgi:hypothetical protein